MRLGVYNSQNIDTNLTISLVPSSAFCRQSVQVEIATNLSVTLPRVLQHTQARNTNCSNRNRFKYLHLYKQSLIHLISFTFYLLNQKMIKKLPLKVYIQEEVSKKL